MIKMGIYFNHFQIIDKLADSLAQWLMAFRHAATLLNLERLYKFTDNNLGGILQARKNDTLHFVRETFASNGLIDASAAAPGNEPARVAAVIAQKKNMLIEPVPGGAVMNSYINVPA